MLTPGLITPSGRGDNLKGTQGWTEGAIQMKIMKLNSLISKAKGITYLLTSLQALSAKS
jgi:hypothetical protein